MHAINIPAQGDSLQLLIMIIKRLKANQKHSVQHWSKGVKYQF